jgi:hypothetical protein
MAIFIIDLLEMIEVERQQGQSGAAAIGPLDLGVGARDELAAIPDTGQRVGGGKMLQLLIAPLHFLQRILRVGHCFGQAAQQLSLAVDRGE